jgi:hypothetical protein
VPTVVDNSKKAKVAIIAGAAAAAIVGASAVLMLPSHKPSTIVLQKAALTVPSNQSASTPNQPKITPTQTRQAATQSTSAPSKVQTLQQKVAAAVTTYNTDFQSGTDQYKQHNYEIAQLMFRNAHTASEIFGQSDARYIDSMYWTAKCQLEAGRFQRALNGLQWVLYMQKAHYGAKSPQVRTTEADIRAAQKGLKRR